METEVAKVLEIEEQNPETTQTETDDLQDWEKLLGPNGLQAFRELRKMYGKLMMSPNVSTPDGKTGLEIFEHQVQLQQVG